MNEPKKTGTEASTETKHDLVPPTGETTEGDVSDQDLKGVAGGIQGVFLGGGAAAVLAAAPNTATPGTQG